MSEGTKKQIRPVFLICLVIVIPLLVFLAELVMKDRTESVLEATALKNPFDEVTSKEVTSGDFSESLDAYVGQQLPQRDRMIELYTEINDFVGVNEINGVVHTKSGYYIERPERYRPKRLKKYARKTAHLAEALSEQGTLFTVAMAGDKNQLLSAEELPTGVYEGRKALNNSRHDAAYLVDRLNRADVDVLDLYDALEAQKDKGHFPFYKTDHHWNRYGVYAAYQQLADYYYREGITKEKPLGEKDFKVYTDNHLFFGSYLRKYGGRLGTSEGEQIEMYLPPGEYQLTPTVGGYYEERTGESEIFLIQDKYVGKEDKYQNYYNVALGGYGMKPVITNRQNPDGPVLILLGDSYSQTLVPMLIANFGKIYFYDVRTFEDSVCDTALQVQADAVLFVCGEIQPNRFVYLNP